jgi:hypothetical protein
MPRRSKRRSLKNDLHLALLARYGRMPWSREAPVLAGPDDIAIVINDFGQDDGRERRTLARLQGANRGSDAGPILGTRGNILRLVRRHVAREHEGAARRMGKMGLGWTSAHRDQTLRQWHARFEAGISDHPNNRRPPDRCARRKSEPARAFCAKLGATSAPEESVTSRQ